MESTLIFTQLLQDVIMKKGETSIQTINLFWNQVDGRESTPYMTCTISLSNNWG
jgi:anaerobic ribonucleoside-triphosphate reductase